MQKYVEEDNNEGIKQNINLNENIDNNSNKTDDELDEEQNACDEKSDYDSENDEESVWTDIDSEESVRTAVSEDIEGNTIDLKASAYDSESTECDSNRIFLGLSQESKYRRKKPLGIDDLESASSQSYMDRSHWCDDYEFECEY